MKGILMAGMLLLLWAISCRKERDTSGLVIIGGYVCGWCAGEDSVILAENRINYRYMDPCDHRAYSKLSPMDHETWNELTGKVNLEIFSGICLNTCNVCADGCDKWITIRNGSFSHTIRYGNQDSALIQSIKPLVNQVDSIRESFRNRKDL